MKLVKLICIRQLVTGTCRWNRYMTGWQCYKFNLSMTMRKIRLHITFISSNRYNIVPFHRVHRVILPLLWNPLIWTNAERNFILQVEIQNILIILGFLKWNIWKFSLCKNVSLSLYESNVRQGMKILGIIIVYFIYEKYSLNEFMSQ